MVSTVSLPSSCGKCFGKINVFPSCGSGCEYAPLCWFSGRWIFKMNQNSENICLYISATKFAAIHRDESFSEHLAWFGCNAREWSLIWADNIRSCLKELSVIFILKVNNIGLAQANLHISAEEVTTLRIPAATVENDTSHSRMTEEDIDNKAALPQ